MRMKNLLSVLLAGVLVAGMAACTTGGSSSTPAPSEAKPESTATESSKPAEPTAESKPADAATGGSDIHVASWNNAADNLTEIANAFNAANPNNGKVIIDYSDSDYSKLKPALAAGQGVPDIFQTQNRDIPAFYNNYGLQAFADLSDIITADADKWVAFALETCKAEDGKYYAIPWDIGPVGLFYRSDVYTDAGIDVKTLTTYDKYIEAGKALKAKGDYYIEAFNFNGSTSTDEFMIYLNQLGGQYYGADGKVNLASDEMLKATTLVQKMITEKVAMDIPNAWDDRITAINDNKLVSLPYPAWYMGTMKNACADQKGKWSIAPLPAFEEGGGNTSNAGGSILAVSATTKNLQLCKDFLAFGMKDNAGNDINMKFGEFPSYKPAYETEYFKSTDEYFGGLAVGPVFAGLTGAPATIWGPYFVDVGESLKVASGEILSQGKDPKTSWTDASAVAQGKIDIK